MVFAKKHDDKKKPAKKHDEPEVAEAPEIDSEPEPETAPEPVSAEPPAATPEPPVVAPALAPVSQGPQRWKVLNKKRVSIRGAMTVLHPGVTLDGESYDKALIASLLDQGVQLEKV